MSIGSVRHLCSVVALSYSLGTNIRTDPVTGNLEFYFPAGAKTVRLLKSYTGILTVIIAVIASVVAVLSYRVILQATQASDGDGSQSVEVSLTPAIVDTIRIIVLEEL